MAMPGGGACGARRCPVTAECLGPRLVQLRIGLVVGPVVAFQYPEISTGRIQSSLPWLLHFGTRAARARRAEQRTQESPTLQTRTIPTQEGGRGPAGLRRPSALVLSSRNRSKRNGTQMDSPRPRPFFTLSPSTPFRALALRGNSGSGGSPPPRRAFGALAHYTGRSVMETTSGRPGSSSGGRASTRRARQGQRQGRWRLGGGHGQCSSMAIQCKPRQGKASGQGKVTGQGKATGRGGRCAYSSAPWRSVVVAHLARRLLPAQHCAHRRGSAHTRATADEQDCSTQVGLRGRAAHLVPRGAGVAALDADAPP